jgi:hypothetical protein
VIASQRRGNLFCDPRHLNAEEGPVEEKARRAWHSAVLVFAEDVVLWARGARYIDHSDTGCAICLVEMFQVLPKMLLLHVTGPAGIRVEEQTYSSHEHMPKFLVEQQALLQTAMQV